jgi:uncharacterized sulfatase
MYVWPDRFSPQDRPELTTSLDIYPTILAAAGVRVPSELPGKNLIPALENNEGIERDCLFGEGFAHDIADLNDPSKSLIYHWVIKGHWKLILRRDGEVHRYKSSHPPTPRAQLYDLKADPNENADLAPQMPDKVAELEKMIDTCKPAKHPETTQN